MNNLITNSPLLNKSKFSRHLGSNNGINIRSEAQLISSDSKLNLATSPVANSRSLPVNKPPLAAKRVADRNRKPDGRIYPTPPQAAKPNQRNELRISNSTGMLFAKEGKSNRKQPSIFSTKTPNMERVSSQSSPDVKFVSKERNLDASRASMAVPFLGATCLSPAQSNTSTQRLIQTALR